jgi:RNA polymerase sigma factor (sigma-70 family)
VMAVHKDVHPEELWATLGKHLQTFEQVLEREGVPENDRGGYPIDYVLDGGLARALQAFRPEKGEIKPWLRWQFRRFVRRSLAQERRELARARYCAEASAALRRGDAAATDVNEHVDLELLRKAIAKDPRREFALLYFGAERESFREVSRQLGISRHLVKKHVNGILEELHQELTDSQRTGQ